jgi:hypothetical protein
MKTFKILFSLMLLSFGAAQLNAQGNSQNAGNAQLSWTKFYDLGNGTGEFVVKISGNLAGNVEAITYTLSGDRIQGQTYGGVIDNSRYISPDPIFTVIVPLLPSMNTGNGNPQEFVDSEVVFELAAGPGPKTKIARRFREPIFR